MKEKNLVDQLADINLPQEEVDEIENKLKDELRISRQQLRREEIRMKKKDRSNKKETAMRTRQPGGAAVVR